MDWKILIIYKFGRLLFPTIKLKNCYQFNYFIKTTHVYCKKPFLIVRNLRFHGSDHLYVYKFTSIETVLDLLNTLIINFTYGTESVRSTLVTNKKKLDITFFYYSHITILTTIIGWINIFMNLYSYLHSFLVARKTICYQTTDLLDDLV